MSITVAPGKKTAQQLRIEIFGEVMKFTPEEVTDLAKEAEEIYNFASIHGHMPSELFSQLVIFLSREAAVLNHPDRDENWLCRSCGKS